MSILEMTLLLKERISFDIGPIAKSSGQMEGRDCAYESACPVCPQTIEFQRRW